MEAESSGLVRFEPSVKFRHPLVRSAVYYSATPEQRRRVHAALAGALDAVDDIDRCVAPRGRDNHPDEQVAPCAGGVGRTCPASGRPVGRRGLPVARRETDALPGARHGQNARASRAEITAGHVHRAKESSVAWRCAAPTDRARRCRVDGGVDPARRRARACEAAALLADVLPIIDTEETSSPQARAWRRSLRRSPPATSLTRRRGRAIATGVSALSEDGTARDGVPGSSMPSRPDGAKAPRPALRCVASSPR